MTVMLTSFSHASFCCLEHNDNAISIMLYHARVRDSFVLYIDDTNKDKNCNLEMHFTVWIMSALEHFLSPTLHVLLKHESCTVLSLRLLPHALTIHIGWHPSCLFVVYTGCCLLSDSVLVSLMYLLCIMLLM